MFVRNILLPVIALASLAACQTAPPLPATPSPKAAIKKQLPGEQSADQANPAKPDTATPAQRLFEQAETAVSQGNEIEAIDRLNQVIELAPNFPRVHTHLGLLLLQIERWDEALHAFQQAIIRDQDDAVAYNHMAVIHRTEGRFEEALKNYREALRANPEYANAHLNIGILLDVYLGDLPAALEHYERYQRLGASNHERVEKWITDIRQRIRKAREQTGS